MDHLHITEWRTVAHTTRDRSICDCYEIIRATVFPRRKPFCSAERTKGNTTRGKAKCVAGTEKERRERKTERDRQRDKKKEKKRKRERKKKEYTERKRMEKNNVNKENKKRYEARDTY